MATGTSPLPSDRQLKELVQEGFTFREISDWVAVRIGAVPNSATLGVALSRAVLRETTGPRYRECVPWRYEDAHRWAYPVRMLRLLGRRRSGLPLAPELDATLETWLGAVAESHAVVGYCRSADGFLYIDEGWREGPNPDIPVRVPDVTVEDLDAIRLRLRNSSRSALEGSPLTHLRPQADG